MGRHDLIKKTNHWTSRSGYTLVEVMVAIGITTVVIGGAGNFYLNSQKRVKSLKAASQMKQLARTLRRVAQDVPAVSFSGSIGLNHELENCIWTDPKNKTSAALASRQPVQCVSTDPSKQIPVHLFIAPKNRKNFDAKRLRVAGTDRDPVWYSLDGKRGCDPKAPDCIFAAKAYFWATCPSDGSDVRNLEKAKAALLFSETCFRAQSISIRTQIVHMHKRAKLEASKRPLNQQLPAIPKDSVFWRNGDVGGDHTIKTATSTNVSSLGLYADYIESCSLNYTLIRVVDSKPICRCLPPYKEMSTGVCILMDHSCPEGERYMGTNLGGEPLCKKVQCSERVYNIGSGTAFEFDCFPYGWVNRIIPEGSEKNCECIPIANAEGPNTELGTWEYLCTLNCAFRVTCCKE